MKNKLLILFFASAILNIANATEPKVKGIFFVGDSASDCGFYDLTQTPETKTPNYSGTADGVPWTVHLGRLMFPNTPVTPNNVAAPSPGIIHLGQGSSGDLRGNNAAAGGACINQTDQIANGNAAFIPSAESQLSNILTQIVAVDGVPTLNGLPLNETLIFNAITSVNDLNASILSHGDNLPIAVTDMITQQLALVAAGADPRLIVNIQFPSEIIINLPAFEKIFKELIVMMGGSVDEAKQAVGTMLDTYNGLLSTACDTNGFTLLSGNSFVAAFNDVLVDGDKIMDKVPGFPVRFSNVLDSAKDEDSLANSLQFLAPEDREHYLWTDGLHTMDGFNYALANELCVTLIKAVRARFQ